ncbi:MAG: ferrienterochelin and colicins outer membrane receptor, partial [bacterium]
MYKKNLLIHLLKGLILVNLVLSTNYINATSFQVFAQSAGSTTASLTGLLTDPDTAAIGKATITAKNIETNFSREIISDENGSFTFSQLPPGNYEITISATGFRTQAIQANLALGITTRLGLILSIGGQQEIIEVIANNLLEEGRTESSTNIDQKIINSLPLNRRNFLDLSLTTARVTADRLPAQGVTTTSGLSINGQPARLNNITIDGLDNNDGLTGSVRSTFSQDAIQEFQVVSDSYSAEFGRAIGGVINIVTKSGTNDLHASLFGFIRNDETSAKDTFSSIEPNYNQYQFGSTLSGPIKKDKALYFT